MNMSMLKLFTGVPQYQNFCRLKEMMSVRKMDAARKPFQFPEGDRIALPDTFEFEGTSRSLSQLLKDTDTAALFVLKDGKVRFEEYWLTGGRDVQWISMSVAKSFVSALVGIAVSEGFIANIEDPITKYLPSLFGSSYDGVRIKDVLQMSSGTRWNEDYNDPASEIFQMRSTMGPGGSLDAFLKGLMRDTEPGTLSRYTSADTQALGLLISEVTGRSLSDYMQRKLCEPLGMESDGYWLLDGSGREMAYAGLNLTARDFAKIGELFRNAGVWEGQQVVPADWVKASVTFDAPHLAPNKPVVGDHTMPMGYGYQWWIPDGDRGEFSGIGVYNQFVFVDPSRGVVIVKLSANPLYGTSSGEKTQKDVQNAEALRAISAAFDTI
jgi:CubicO group peptidase (beta-lactamase class C family)